MQLANIKKILVIQTAFIGDAVLATPVVEKLHQYYPEAKIDFLLRKGNEKLFFGHPFIHEALVWDKINGKTKNLIKLIFEIRKRNYDLVVNLQRYFSSGLLMGLSGSRFKVCFLENPLSFLSSSQLGIVKWKSLEYRHEIERNIKLISQITDDQIVKPRLYPSKLDFEKTTTKGDYITISPASVWATKQFPREKWLEFMDRVGEDTAILLLGGANDKPLCHWLSTNTVHQNTSSKAGELTFLESAALMVGAKMNFVNDSAPLHFASAMNAPVTAIFCSTVPGFGFGPLADNSALVQTAEPLDCRPCGLHGRKFCPKGHFKCSEIPIERLLSRIQ